MAKKRRSGPRPARRCPFFQAAKAAGTKTYSTGKPCKHGHIAPRNTVDNSCTACRVNMHIAARPRMAEYMRKKRVEMLATDPEGTREKWRKEHREQRAKNLEKYRALERKHGKLRRQRHPGRKLAEVRKRQAAIIHRTPPWADFKAIRRIYEGRPPGHEVDHIVPLRGRNVCGLHVHYNLQYLPKVENRLKGNRLMEAANG